MKKLKGFTLVELLVAIAIFGILMTGVVQLMSPITEISTSAKIANNQQMVENAICNYIGENLRYTSNLLIVEEGVQITPAGGATITVDSAEDAIDAFYAMQPVDEEGNVLAPNSDQNEDRTSVICFDYDNDQFRYHGRTYRGRLLTSVDTRYAESNPNLDFSHNGGNMSNLKQDGTTNQYIAFGNDYYGPGDFYLTKVGLNASDHTLELECASDYYFTNAAKGNSNKKSSSDNNPITGTYELRNYGKGTYMFQCIVKDNSPSLNYANTPKTGYTKLYFVFIKDIDNMVASGTPGAAPVITTGCSVTT